MFAVRIILPPLYKPSYEACDKMVLASILQCFVRLFSMDLYVLMCMLYSTELEWITICCYTVPLINRCVVYCVAYCGICTCICTYIYTYFRLQLQFDIIQVIMERETSRRINCIYTLVTY